MLLLSLSFLRSPQCLCSFVSCKPRSNAALLLDADSLLRIVRRSVHADQQRVFVRGYTVTVLHAGRDADVVARSQRGFHSVRPDHHLAADDVKAVLSIRMNVLAG